MERICAVCNQPIQPDLAIPIGNGEFAHYGQCFEHAKSIPVSENQTDVLAETELLL